MITAEEFLARVEPATPKQRTLWKAIRDAGWVLRVDPERMMITAAHPDNQVEIPTPEYIPDAWWPQPHDRPRTHNTHRGLTMLFHLNESGVELPAAGPIGIRFGTVFARQAAAPWVSSSEYAIGLGAAMDYVAAPHPAAPYRPPSEETP